MAARYGPALVEAAEYYRSVYEHLMQLLVLEGIADDPPAVVYDPPDCPPLPNLLLDVQPAQRNQATQTPDSARPVRPPGLFARDQFGLRSCLQPALDVQPAKRNRYAQTPDSWLTEYVRSDGVRIYRC